MSLDPDFALAGRGPLGALLSLIYSERSYR